MSLSTGMRGHLEITLYIGSLLLLSITSPFPPQQAVVCKLKAVCMKIELCIEALTFPPKCWMQVLRILTLMPGCG
jgi:hypothetical protein